MGEQISHVPLVTFLTDFGTEDVFVGLCHVAVLEACAQARVVDLSHAVAPQDVLQGAARLADAVGWAPSGAVHLAVVDPGVGTARAGLAIATPGGWLVGPDNGLLTFAAERLGGVVGAWALDVDESASTTFHGRDVFAPAAGRLAAGADPDGFGTPVDPAALVRVAAPEPSVDDGYVDTPIRDVDRYGNVQLWLRPDDLARAGVAAGARATVHARGRSETARRVRTFGDLRAGELGLVEDSFGWMAVVAAGDDAAATLAVDVHDPLTVQSGVPDDLERA